jgi:hypothetical protein
MVLVARVLLFGLTLVVLAATFVERLRMRRLARVAHRMPRLRVVSPRRSPR